MAIIAWIISAASLFAGLALRQDVPFAHAGEIANGLLATAFLSCPMLWADAPLGLGGRQRLVLCLAMLLALPAMLMPR